MPFAQPGQEAVCSSSRGRGYCHFCPSDLGNESHVYVRNSIPQWVLLGDKRVAFGDTAGHVHREL